MGQTDVDGTLYFSLIDRTYVAGLLTDFRRTAKLGRRTAQFT